MPRGKKKEGQDAFSMFVGQKYEGPPQLDEAMAEEEFGKHSAVGLTDMLVAATGAGGFTQDIILEDAPDSLRGDDVTQKALDQFWALLVFFTERHEWTPLPGMPGYGKAQKKTRKPRTSQPEADSDAGQSTTVVGKVLAFAQEQGGKVRALKRFLKEQGTVPALAEWLSGKLDVTVTTANMRLILHNLGISARDVLG